MQVCTDFPKIWGNLKILDVGRVTKKIHVEGQQNLVFRIISAFFLCMIRKGLEHVLSLLMPTQAICCPRAAGWIGLVLRP